MPGDLSTQPVGIVGQFENLVKIVTGAVGLVAAIGFPAVAVHLASYGVPVRTASYDFILRAGVLPAFVLVVMVAYAYAASKIVATSGIGGLLTINLVPIFVPAMIVIMGGVLAYFSLVVWAVLWVFAWLARTALGRSVNNRTLLIAAGAGMVAFYSVYFVALATRRYWVDRPGRFWQLLARIVDKAGIGDAKRDETPAVPEGERAAAPVDAPANTPRPEATTSRFEWAIGLVFIPVSLLFLYSIKGVLYVWDPRLAAFLPHRYIFYASIILGLLFTLLMIGLTMVQKASVPVSGQLPGPSRTMIATVALAYILFEVSYCMWGYPRLYSAFGGGRPTAVTMWLKPEDGLADILAILKKARQTTIVGARKLDGVFVLFDSADGILLTDASASPGTAIFIRRDRVAALSW